MPLEAPKKRCLAKLEYHDIISTSALSQQIHKVSSKSNTKVNFVECHPTFFQETRDSYFSFSSSGNPDVI